MIKLERFDIFGWEAAFRGLTNSFNRWNESDSYDGFYCIFKEDFEEEKSNGNIPPKSVYTRDYINKGCSFVIGKNDLKFLKNLSKTGNEYAKFLKMIKVSIDITAPLYWWSKFDMFDFDTIDDSYSIIRKIHEKEFALEDFSCEHLNDDVIKTPFNTIIDCLNFFRELYLQNKDKDDWWQMVQLLPSSYNQRRTVMLNYEILTNIYHSMKDHKLDEWRDFCKWIDGLPYSELITGKEISDA